MVQQGVIEFSASEGVTECRPTSSLLQIGGFRLLIDTEHPKESREEYVRALEAAGSTPEQIDGVVFTHLHPDHFGHKELFPQALFIFHESEKFGFCFKDDRTLLLRGHALLGLDQAGRVTVEPTVEEPSLRGLGERIYVRHIPGHTLGSIALFAMLDGLVYAWVGDTFLNREYFDRLEVPGFSLDPVAVQGNMAYIKAKADVIIPGHGAPFLAR